MTLVTLVMLAAYNSRARESVERVFQKMACAALCLNWHALLYSFGSLPSLWPLSCRSARAKSWYAP